MEYFLEEKNSYMPKSTIPNQTGEFDLAEGYRHFVPTGLKFKK